MTRICDAVILAALFLIAAAITLALFPMRALGQTVVQSVSQPAPIWYGPPGAGWVTISGTAQLMTGPTSAQTPATVGQAVGLPPIIDPASKLPIAVFDLAFPAISSSATTQVTGLVLTLQPSGGGLIFKPVVEIYPIVFTVPPNGTVTVHYDASLSAAVAITSGASAGTVTATVTVPPAPPPPTFTADGTRMPPAAQLVDASGATWTIGALCGSDGKAGQVSIYRNGVRQFCSIDFATIKAGVVWVSDFGSGPGWSKWSGSAFVSSSTGP